MGSYTVVSVCIIGSYTVYIPWFILKSSVTSLADVNITDM
jgi:hypothetical protein